MSAEDAPEIIVNRVEVFKPEKSAEKTFVSERKKVFALPERDAFSDGLQSLAHRPSAKPVLLAMPTPFSKTGRPDSGGPSGENPGPGNSESKKFKRNAIIAWLGQFPLYLLSPGAGFTALAAGQLFYGVSRERAGDSTSDVLEKNTGGWCIVLGGVLLVSNLIPGVPALTVGGAFAVLLTMDVFTLLGYGASKLVNRIFKN